MSKRNQSLSNSTSDHNDSTTNTNDLNNQPTQDSTFYKTNLNLGTNKPQNVEQPFAEMTKDVKVSDIIGDFGPYQIAVVLFAALRAMSCAMDGLSGPFVSPNVKSFQCEVCESSSANYSAGNGVCSYYIGGNNKIVYELDQSNCFFSNPSSDWADRINCNKWSFDSKDNEKVMQSLTVEQSLVCDREWLKSLSNSMYFVGATFGLLFWGVISDRYGRKTAYVCSHFVTLIFGFSALFAESMCTYILLRAINAFGMIGELIPRSIQVEMVATKYRFICSVICQIGWATGIILVPVLSYFNSSYRFILAFPVVVSALMLPWLIWLPESARWLITKNKFSKAKAELRRAAKINGRLTDDIDMKIERYNRQVLHTDVGVSKKRIGIGRSILAIFTNRHLLKDTMAVFALLFVAEVVYFSLTLNVADLSGSLYINYIISGVSELVSIAFCALMLAFLSRRSCLSILLLASTVSYLLMALVNVYEKDLSMVLILSVNAFGKLTAIGNLMVIVLVSQEVFPTVIRQFGTSLCITVGKAGSAVAPFTHELGQMIGHSYCFAMFSIICLISSLIPLGLSETGNCELPDTVIDVEASSKRKHKNNSNQDDHKSGHQNNYVAHYESNKNNDCLRLPNGFIDVAGSQNGIDCEDGTKIDGEDLNNNSIQPDELS